MIPAVVLAAVNVSASVWQSLPTEYKTKIKTQVLKGNIGMAKIILARGKKAAKAKIQTKTKAKRKPKPNVTKKAKRRGKR